MTLPTAADMTRTMPLLESSSLLDDPPALRARAAEHGYLFFRGLLPAEDVLGVRRKFLQILDQHGWLAAGMPLMDGIADVAAFAREDPKDLELCGVGVTTAAYRDVQRVRDFHQLSDHPRLLALYAALFEAPVLRHPRNIARLMMPGGTTRPTPPHQDFIHIQGSPDVWTAWLPLGDCPRSLGGLTVLDRSHQDGLLSHKAAEGAGGLEAYLCNLDLTWAEADFAAGDVVTFTSRTVHKALPSQQPQRVRLSCDFRYQPVNDEIERRSLDVHCGVTTWEDVYSAWPDKNGAWYWRDLPLRCVEWDESIRWQQDKIC